MISEPQPNQTLTTYLKRKYDDNSMYLTKFPLFIDNADSNVYYRQLIRITWRILRAGFFLWSFLWWLLGSFVLWPRIAPLSVFLRAGLLRLRILGVTAGGAWARPFLFGSSAKQKNIILQRASSHAMHCNYLSSSLDELSEEESLFFSFLEVLEDRPERVRLLFLAAGLEQKDW